MFWQFLYIAGDFTLRDGKSEMRLWISPMHEEPWFRARAAEPQRRTPSDKPLNIDN